MTYHYTQSRADAERYLAREIARGRRGAQPGRHSVNKSEFFGRINDAGTVDVFHVDGTAATRLNANVYPVGSQFSARYQHPGGITLRAADALRIGLSVEV